MKLHIIYIALTVIPANVNSAHRSNDGMTPIPQPKNGWFGGRRGSDSNGSNDVLKTSAMHSFTGIEGIDHDVHPPETDEKKDCKKSKKSQAQVKEVKKVEKEEHINGESRFKNCSSNVQE